MRFIGTSLLAATLLGLASQAYACVDFAFEINPDAYGSGNLKDNGAMICNFNGYGDNTGYNLKCNSGYSARVDNSGTHVSYNTPHGSYTFTAKCTSQGGPYGVYTACSASPFC